MCGIICALNIKNNEKNLRKQVLRQAKKLRHRGPDWSGIFSDNNAILAHERLSIVDIVHGAQPLYNTKTSAVLAVNGEIYNHADLEKQLRQEHEFQTKSDCEVVLYLYEELGPTKVIPGSHKAGRKPKEGEDNWNGQTAKSVMVKSGDATIHRAEIWHRGSANKSNKNSHNQQFNTARFRQSNWYHRGR